MGFIKYKRYFRLSIIRNIIYYFFNLFLFFLVIFLLCNLILDKENTTKIFRFNFSRVSSDSMLPKMRVDDIVFFTLLDEDKCKLLKTSNPGKLDGDIIIFKADSSEFAYLKDSFIIHRVVFNNTQEKYVTTKGDNNSFVQKFEEKIPYHNVFYKYSFKIPYEITYILIWSMILLLFYFIIFDESSSNDNLV
ncbi:MAG: signal peptidase I [Candidatus Phytoplasma australasiaticum]|nr:MULTISPECIES: signal peptidase I [Phytoplasma]MCG3566642.1 signal peptidase I [Sesame phyllody phytoplasma]MDO8031477.1 signal peptidase I [Candidatus Phytoplasma australasiaticum]MDO8046470.1 signal peptidase I [Candidatus Phytoplasma australasiaticum]MDO8053075.1 signal peptidase I [Candidatus Phytoplasma australasiaticum]MDO8058075.1 signal peptidase I [Candidatus Phytoplasma australasiaticum]